MAKDRRRYDPRGLSAKESDPGARSGGQRPLPYILCFSAPSCAIPTAQSALANFSDSATAADRKFQAACRHLGVSAEMVRHPLAGPEGEPVHLGVARIGPVDAPNVLALLSGVHGVEGFAGAGLQVGLLRRPDPLGLPPETAMLLVHLVNPWGLAWNRREDHENIDVFRNLLYAAEPSQPDPLFDAVEDALDLAHWTDPDRGPAEAKLQTLIDQHGEARLVAAVRRGQHHRPKGLTYHGQDQCWSKRVLDETMPRYLQRARRVAVIDVHTGFGAPGEALVMSYEAPDSPKYERVRRWMDGEIYTPGVDADIPAHPARPYAFLERLVPGAEVTATILEYGTEPPEVTRALFAANAHYHLYGDPLSLAGRAVGERYRQFCYPATDEWKQAVWDRGVAVVERVARGLGDWSREV